MENQTQNLIPNTTQTPNVLFDAFLSFLSEGELKCYLYAVRRTLGFHKGKDRISLSQFVSGLKTKEQKVLDRGTGLSRQTVVDSLASLVRVGLLKVTYTSKGNIYELVIHNLDVDKVVQNLDQSKIKTKTGLKSRPKLVLFLDTQKKEKQRETKTNVNGLAALHRRLIDYFYNTSYKTRKVKPIIGGKSAKVLKDFLKKTDLTEIQLEQLIAYYLASPQFKTFSPDLAVLFSGGVMNVLMNKMKNDPNFWRDMDNFSYQLRGEGISDQARTELAKKFEALRASLTKQFAIG